MRIAAKAPSAAARAIALWSSGKAGADGAASQDLAKILGRSNETWRLRHEDSSRETRSGASGSSDAGRYCSEAVATKPSRFRPTPLQSLRGRSGFAQRVCSHCESDLIPPNGSAAAADTILLAQRLCCRYRGVFLAPFRFAAAAETFGVRYRLCSRCEDVWRQISALQPLRRRLASDIGLAAAANALGDLKRACSDDQGVGRIAPPFRSRCGAVGRRNSRSLSKNDKFRRARPMVLSKRSSPRHLPPSPRSVRQHLDRQTASGAEERQ